MVDPVRFLLALASFCAVAFGQGRDTSLLLTIRTECGIANPTYSLLPGTDEGVLRFRYLARTGAQGGRFYLELPSDSGGVHIKANIEGPVKIIEGHSREGSGSLLLAEITPNGRTTKAGYLGEVRLVWRKSHNDGGTPRLSLACN